MKTVVIGFLAIVSMGLVGCKSTSVTESRVDYDERYQECSIGNTTYDWCLQGEQAAYRVGSKAIRVYRDCAYNEDDRGVVTDGKCEERIEKFDPITGVREGRVSSKITSILKKKKGVRCLDRLRHFNSRTDYYDYFCYSGKHFADSISDNPRSLRNSRYRDDSLIDAGPRVCENRGRFSTCRAGSHQASVQKLKSISVEDSLSVYLANSNAIYPINSGSEVKIDAEFSASIDSTTTVDEIIQKSFDISYDEQTGRLDVRKAVDAEFNCSQSGECVEKGSVKIGIPTDLYNELSQNGAFAELEKTEGAGQVNTVY
ncbi:MAG: hypothetical protein R2827_14990 [Bdellovibrionales bacterium]